MSLKYQVYRFAKQIDCTPVAEKAPSPEKYFCYSIFHVSETAKTRLVVKS